MPITKCILYPVFLECLQFTDDTFWKNIFDDLAYGKTPYGTYISKNFLCCSYKDKEFGYKIERKDPQILYTDIYNLLSNKLGLLSHKEKIKKRVDFHKIETSIKEFRAQSWSNIRKQNIKDLLIERYVIDMKKKYSLSLKQAKYLLSIIFIAIIFKIITSNNIYYSDGKIQNIDCIDFSKKKFVLKTSIYDINVSFSPEIVVDKKLMSENWEKYLSSLRKYIH